MNAVIEFYETYGSTVGLDPVHADEIPFTYDQVFDDQFHLQVVDAVRKMIHKKFKGQGIIFHLDGKKVANYRF